MTYSDKQLETLLADIEFQIEQVTVLATVRRRP